MLLGTSLILDESGISLSCDAWSQTPVVLPPLQRHGADTSSDGSIYIVGGETASGYSDKTYYVPTILFSKSADPAGMVYVGDRITYTILFTSTGIRAFEDMLITDSIPGNTRLVTTSISATIAPDSQVITPSWDTRMITFTIPHLNELATGVASFQVDVVDPSVTGIPISVQGVTPAIWPSTLTPSSMANALHTTWADATCTPTHHEMFKQDCVSGGSGPNCDADLCLEKSSDQASVIAGQALTYTLLVHNNGPLTAEDVVVTDDLPGGVTFALATPPPSSTSPLTWYVGSILSKTSQVITLTVQVDSGISGILTNTASVDSSTPDPNPDNNKDEEQTDVVIRKADLRVAKFDDPDPANPGGMLTYTLWITNAGPSEATNVIVTDTLPAECGLLDPLPPNCRPDPFVCNLGTLLPGRDQKIQIRVTVCPTSTGALLNEAEVRSDVPDDTPGNNKAQEWTTITLADLRIKKGDSLSNGKVIPGEILVYNLRVNNEGPADANNVVVSDTLPPGVSFRSSVPPLTGGPDPLTWYTGTLSVGEVWTIEITVAVNSSAVGLLTNTVCVRSDDSDPDRSDNCDEEGIWAPVAVTNKAYICEDGLWCKEAIAINPPFSVYLPIILKASSAH